MYILSASHGFDLNGVDLLYCKYGMRMGVGGNPCRISNVHVAVGCFSGMNDYLASDNRMYGIHTKGGLVIDGIYYEQYSGQLDISNYTLIDYEGWGNGGIGKLIIKNTPIGNMGAGNKGYFFSGSTFIGPGEETGSAGSKITKQDRNNYFGNGCVEFINCITTGSINTMKEKIKKSFKIDGGLDKAFGIIFNNLELFGDGLAFTKNYKRRFNSYLSDEASPANNMLVKFSTNNIPAENRTWSNIDFPMNPIYDNAGNVKGTSYKGTITINKIQDTNTRVTLGLIGNVKGNNVMIREFVTLDSTSINKMIKIYVDEYIPLTEASQVFFGYRCNGTGAVADRIKKSDEKNVIYDIEISYDTLEMYN